MDSVLSVNTWNKCQNPASTHRRATNGPPAIRHSMAYRLTRSKETKTVGMLLNFKIGFLILSVPYACVLLVHIEIATMRNV